MRRTLLALLPVAVFLLYSSASWQVQSLPVAVVRASDPTAKAALEGRHGSLSASVGGSFEERFNQGSLDHSRWMTSGYWANVQPFNAGWDPAYWTIDGTVLILMLKRIPFRRQEWDLPFTSGELRSTQFYGAGCFSVCMKPSKISGVSSSFYIQNGFWDSPFKREDGPNSLFHNEIDVEFVGYDTSKIQTNFFSRIFNPKQNSGSGNEQMHDLGFVAGDQFAAYSFKWTKDRVDWWVNDRHIRTVTRDDCGQDSALFPDPEFSPVRIAANIWPVNKQAEEWAGPLDPNFQETDARYAWIAHSQGNECQVKMNCGF